MIYPGTLLDRVLNLCRSGGFNFVNLLLNEDCLTTVKNTMFLSVKDGDDGLVDSLRMVLKNKSDDNLKYLRLLLRAY